MHTHESDPDLNGAFGDPATPKKRLTVADLPTMEEGESDPDSGAEVRPGPNAEVSVPAAARQADQARSATRLSDRAKGDPLRSPCLRVNS